MGEATGDPSQQCPIVVSTFCSILTRTSRRYVYFFRVTECSNSFFCLQKRRGQGDGRGFAAKVIGTLDNIRDTRPAPFRILLQTVSTIWSSTFKVRKAIEPMQDPTLPLPVCWMALSHLYTIIIARNFCLKKIFTNFPVFRDAATFMVFANIPAILR